MSLVLLRLNVARGGLGLVAVTTPEKALTTELSSELSIRYMRGSEFPHVPNANLLNG